MSKFNVVKYGSVVDTFSDELTANRYADLIRAKGTGIVVDVVPVLGFMLAAENLQVLYLSWVNDFLTVPVFAAYYNLRIETAERIIKIGRAVHERAVERFKLSQVCI